MANPFPVDITKHNTTGRPAAERGRKPASRTGSAVFQPLGVDPKPCNCGNLGHYSVRCRGTPDQIARYRSKISGPLLDRIEIRIEVPAVPPEELQRAAQGESSATVRVRVVEAHELALKRQGKANAEPTHCGAPKQPSSTAGPRTCALSSCSSDIPGSKVQCGISELRLMTHWRLPSRPKHSPVLRWRRPPDWAAAFLQEIATGLKKNWTDILGVSDPKRKWKGSKSGRLTQS